MQGKQFVITKEKTKNEEIIRILGEHYAALITPIILENKVSGFISAASKEHKDWHPIEKKYIQALSFINRKR